MKKDNLRHILKTVSYRFFSMVITFLITFLFTGNVIIGLGISSVELIIKSILYYTHERVWYKNIRFTK